MPLPSKALVRQLLAPALLALVASGCATAYVPKGLGGGYSDERIDDTHYIVRFSGNGHTDKEKVWHFWFYRCADLTAQKGFAYFDLETTKNGTKQSLLDAPSRPPEETRYAVYRPGEGRGLVVPARGYSTIYIPGGTVTTWTSSAVVAMYSEIPAGKTLISAQRVLELLGPYVRVHGYATPPDFKTLLRGSVMKLGANQTAERMFPDGSTVGYVDLRRVLQTIAEAKAVRTQLEASVAKRRAEVEAAQAKIDQLRKSYDAEPDASRRTALETELATRKLDLKSLVKRFKEELAAEQERSMRPILERVEGIVERVRSAQRLDIVLEQNAGGLWDQEITNDVIREYQQSYPVPQSS